MTIIGMVVSAPFVLIGLGLVAFLPLLIFYLATRDLHKAVVNNTALNRNNYWTYFISALLAGSGSAFGFFMFWSISHGIDTVETPFAPFIVMAVAGCPLITIWVISVGSGWQHSIKRVPVSA